MIRAQQAFKIAFTGLFAALVFLATWAIHFPVGANGGYLHFGDSLVYLAATILPLPYAMAASSIGAGLSDLLSPGGAVWILPTIIIKPLCCLAFTPYKQQILCKRNTIALFFAGFINLIGYFFATAIITGSFGVAVAELPFSFAQPIGSTICFLVWGFSLDKVHIKEALPGPLQGGNKV